jgi:DNA-binding XRE family transcriptional regulator
MGKDDSYRDDPISGSLYAEQDGEGSPAQLHSRAVGELTPREKLILYRRRLEFSQEQMAAVFGIHRETYGRIERGQVPQTDDVVGDLGGLSDHEKCYILRKRAGRKQIECAQEMGVTRFWFNQMELGKAPCDPLIEFWRRHAG